MKIKNIFPRRIFILSAFFLASVTFSNCTKDALPEADYTSDFKASALAATKAPAGAYNIVNSLPKGYVKDGSKDYTAYLQSAINKYSNIVFPGFPILVNSDGLKLKSNQTITFLNGSEIRLKPTALGNYNIFYIYHVDNVKLIDPKIVGDRPRHLGKTGEYGSGIVISSSSNVEVKNPVISECWGDAIHIRQPKNDNRVPKNITITGGVFRKNRRNAISVVSVDGLKVFDTYVYGLYESEGGTRPMSGIDLEPVHGEGARQQIKNVLIRNIKTEHMGAEGIQIRLKRLYGVSGKSVDITIENHEDIGSPLAALLVEVKNLNNDPSISGHITVNNPVWRKNPKYVSYSLGLDEPRIKFNLYKPKLYNMSNKLMSTKETNEKIMRYTRSNVNLNLVQ